MIDECLEFDRTTVRFFFCGEGGVVRFDDWFMYN